MFSMQQRCTSKHKIGGIKVCKAEELKIFFVNPKTETEVFGYCVNYIICSLDFRNTEAVVLRCSSEQVFLNIL